MSATRLVWKRTGTLAGKPVFIANHEGDSFRIAYALVEPGRYSWTVRDGFWWNDRGAVFRARDLADAKKIAERRSKQLDKENEVRWTPVRRGAAYCSPGCGSSCTWAAYQKAVAAGAALARKLGEGWTPYITENMRWYYQARSGCGQLHVHKSSGQGYSAYFGKNFGGRWVGKGRTPSSAVRDVLRLARAERDEIAGMIGAAVPYTGGGK